MHFWYITNIRYSLHRMVQEVYGLSGSILIPTYTTDISVGLVWLFLTPVQWCRACMACRALYQNLHILQIYLQGLSGFFLPLYSGVGRVWPVGLSIGTYIYYRYICRGCLAFSYPCIVVSGSILILKYIYTIDISVGVVWICIGQIVVLLTIHIYLQDHSLRYDTVSDIEMLF